MERCAKKVCKKRKKDLTESTLLEMSEYATNQDLKKPVDSSS